MILTGEDAVRFHKALESNKVPKEDRDKVKKLAKDVLNKSKKYIITAELRKITDSWLREEISYSKMGDLINELIDRKING